MRISSIPRDGWMAGLAVAVAVLWSLVPLVLLAVHVVLHGGHPSGSDGPLAGADQLFYLDSIRQSGSHVLIADHFDLVVGHPVFLHPLYLVGGGLWLVGLPLQAVLWILQPLAAVAVAAGALVLAGRVLADRPRQVVASLLGLFYLTPLLPLLAWSGVLGAVPRYQLLLVAGEVMPAWQLWGYPHTGLAVAALALALVGAAAIARGITSPGCLAAVAGGACLSAWLHPWQGAIFILVAAALAVQARAWRPALWLGVAVLGAAAPMIYETVLSHTDAAWRVDSAQNAVGQGPGWTLLAGLVPLALPAVLGIRRVAPGPLRTILVGWPLAALVVYFATDQFPFHALDGISIPLAALAVLAWPAGGRSPGRATVRRGRAWSAVAAALVALAVVPGAIYEITTFRASERSGAAPYFFTSGERAALSFLEHDARPGGVLARDYLGMAVPAFTGRRTWVGEWTWTPGFSGRATLAERLLAGSLAPRDARRAVISTGARFVLGDCGTRAPVLAHQLGSLVVGERTFGCATVLELASRPSRA